MSEKELLRLIINDIDKRGIKIKKSIQNETKVSSDSFFENFIDLTYKLGKLNEGSNLPNPDITYKDESWYLLIYFFQTFEFETNTLYYHFLKFAALNLERLISNYGAKFMIQLFMNFEENAITGLFRIPKNDELYNFMATKFKNIPENNIISNTQIVLMINKLKNKLNNKTQTKKNKGKNIKKNRRRSSRKINKK